MYTHYVLSNMAFLYFRSYPLCPYIPYNTVSASLIHPWYILQLTFSYYYIKHPNLKYIHIRSTSCRHETGPYSIWGLCEGKKKSFIFKKVLVKRESEALNRKPKMEPLHPRWSLYIQVAGTSSHITGKSFLILNTLSRAKKISSESLVAAPYPFYYCSSSLPGVECHRIGLGQRGLLPRLLH